MTKSEREYLERKIELCIEMNMPLEKFAYTDALKKARALQLQQTGVSGSVFDEIYSDLTTISASLLTKKLSEFEEDWNL